MLWQLGLLALLCVTGECEKDSAKYDGRSSKKENKDVEDAMIQLEAVINSETLNLKFNIGQKLPKDYEMSSPEIMAEIGEGTAADKLTTLKAYITKTESCTDWTIGDEDIDISSFIKGSESETGPDSETPPDAKEEDGMKDIGNLFDLVGRYIVVVDADNNKLCGKLDIKELKDVEVLTMKYSKSMESSKDKLIALIAKRTSLPEDGIQILKKADEGDCAVVEIYFNVELDDAILGKLYTAFGRNNELGIYSPTEKCMTTLEGTFINEMIIKRFLKEDDNDGMEKETPEKPSCFVGSRAQIKEYEVRVRRYDQAMKDWIQQFGSAKLQNNENIDEFIKSYGKDYSEQDNSIRRNYDDDGNNVDLKMLLKFLGKTEGSGLRDLKMELNRITQAGDDYDKMQMILQKIRELTDEQKDIEQMSKYGLCLVSKMGDSGMKKLQEIRNRLKNASDWLEEDDKVLKELILEGLTEKLEKVASKEIVMFDEMVDQRSSLSTKFQMILDVNVNCSTEEERYGVGMALGSLNYTVPDMLEPYFNEFEENEDIKTFLVTLNDTFTKDFDETSKILWVAIYTPGFMSKNNSLFRALSKINSLSDASRRMLYEKLKGDIESVSVENLMKLQTLLMTDNETKMKCSLKNLATQVRKLYPENEEETPCDGGVKYNYPRQGDDRRDVNNRRDTYYREDNYRGDNNYRADNNYRDRGYGNYARDGYRGDINYRQNSNDRVNYSRDNYGYRTDKRNNFMDGSWDRRDDRPNRNARPFDRYGKEDSE